MCNSILTIIYSYNVFKRKVNLSHKTANRKVQSKLLKMQAIAKVESVIYRYRIKVAFASALQMLLQLSDTVHELLQFLIALSDSD